MGSIHKGFAPCHVDLWKLCEEKLLCSPSMLACWKGFRVGGIHHGIAHAIVGAIHQPLSTIVDRPLSARKDLLFGALLHFSQLRSKIRISPAIQVYWPPLHE